MKLINSTTFQLLIVLLIIGAYFTHTTTDLTWKDWMDYAFKGLFFYAAKESVKYGATAYKESNVTQ